MKRKQPGRKGFDLNYEEIGKEYLNGENLKNLANKYNISIWTLLARFKKLGIRKRIDREENIEVFNEFTKDSCYWGGFIAADGNIAQYSVSCELATVDINHLEKFRVFLQSNAKINERIRVVKNKEFKYCSIHIHNKNLVDILKNGFNLIAKKSLILLPPDKIPNGLIKHYIRGYIDGDGCIYWNKSNKKTRLVICSGSLELLCWIDSNLKLLYDIGNPKIKKVNNRLLYTIGYSKNILTALNDLYKDGERLERKFNKYLELKNKTEQIILEKEDNRKDKIAKTIKLYNERYSLEDIAKEIDVSYGFVKYCINKEVLVKRKRLSKKERLVERNLEICKKFICGVSAKDLSEEYNISKYSIWKITKKGTNGVSNQW